MATVKTSVFSRSNWLRCLIGSAALVFAAGIANAYTTDPVTGCRIFRFTLSTKVRTVKVLGGSDAEVIEYIVNPDSPITKAPIKDLHFPSDAIIGGVIRGNETMIAQGDTWIKPYDRAVIFALPTALSRIEKLFS